MKPKKPKKPVYYLSKHKNKMCVSLEIALVLSRAGLGELADEYALKAAGVANQAFREKGDLKEAIRRKIELAREYVELR